MITLTAENNKIHSLKLALWLGLAGVVMLFAGLISAVLVRSASRDWAAFKLPDIFWINTLVIMVSSATMHWAFYSYKKYNYTNYRIALLLTLVLGCAFVYLQYYAWHMLPKIGVFLDNNVAGAFLIVISLVHLAHVIGGLVVLLVASIRSFVRSFNPNKLINVELMSIYWHFVDVLWLFLIIFFSIKLA